LKAPADAAKSFVVSANIKASCVLILIQGILSGLFSMCVVSKLNKYIDLATDDKDFVDMFSKGNAFLYTLLMSVVFSIVFMLLAWAVAAISKGKTNYQQMLSVAAVRSSYLVPVEVIAILVFFIKPMYGIALFYVAGGFMACIALVEALRVVPGIDENIKTYLTTIAMIIFTVIVLYFTIKLSPKSIASEHAKQMNNLLENISEAKKELRELDTDDIYDGIFSMMRSLFR
jgi:acid phosphatase family membrane protein YuiD